MTIPEDVHGAKRRFEGIIKVPGFWSRSQWSSPISSPITPRAAIEDGNPEICISFEYRQERSHRDSSSAEMTLCSRANISSFCKPVLFSLASRISLSHNLLI